MVSSEGSLTVQRVLRQMQYLLRCRRASHPPCYRGLAFIARSEHIQFLQLPVYGIAAHLAKAATQLEEPVYFLEGYLGQKVCATIPVFPAET